MNCENFIEYAKKWEMHKYALKNLPEITQSTYNVNDRDKSPLDTTFTAQPA